MFSTDRQGEREYNKKYAKGVEPRFYSSYKKEYPCIITSDKCQVRLLQRNFKHSTRREGRLYIVTLQLRKIYPNVIY